MGDSNICNAFFLFSGQMFAYAEKLGSKSDKIKDQNYYLNPKLTKNSVNF